MKVTIAETGLPGSPNTTVPSRVPNQVGRPGRSATRQKTSSTPSACSAGLTWSWGPTETPPESTRTSVSSSAAAMAARVASSVSATTAVRSTCAPACVASAASVAALELCSWPGPSGPPGATSSSPVARTTTRGLRAQRTRSAAGLDGDPDLGGADARARRQDGRARAQIVAGRAHVAAGVDLVVERHAIAVDGHELDLQDRVGPVGQCGAGRDAHRLPFADGHGGGRPRARLADDPQGSPGWAGTQGEAVHRAVGERGDVALGDDVLGQHAAERILDRDVLGG